MRFIPTLAAIALTLAGSAVYAQKSQLLVYTALETDQIKAYQDGFAKVEPNIEIKWVRDSTGVVIAKLLAEKANPQADVIWGVAASGLALFDKLGMLEPYAPLNLDAIMPQYRDKKNPPAWWGMDVYGAVVCFNTVEAAKRHIPKPVSRVSSRSALSVSRSRSARRLKRTQLLPIFALGSRALYRSAT